MTTTFTGYSDAFAGTSRNISAGESNLHKLASRIRTLKKKNRKLKLIIIEQRATEEKRIAEQQRTVQEAKKEQSLSSKIGDAFVKAIPTLVKTVVSFFLKRFFSREK